MTNSEQAIREFAEKLATYCSTLAFMTEGDVKQLADSFHKPLTALISEHYYTREFLLWFHDNVQIESQEETFLVYNDIRFYTLNEVRDFWQRVQEKKEYIKRKENER